MESSLKHFGKIYAAFLIVLAFAPMTAGAQNGLVKLDRPSGQEIAGFNKIFCVRLDAANRICNGLPDDEHASGNARFFVERDGKQIGGWNSEAFLGDVSRFEVWRGDLDHDGKNEIIVITFNRQSNGMGINSWTIYVLPSSWKNADAAIEPLQFSTEDFSVPGGFVKNPKTGQLEILISNWEWNWQQKGKKEGLYLIVRRFKYKDGALIASAKPLTVRRYTKKFEQERLATLETGKIPLIWTTSADAEIRNVDLMNTAEGKTVVDGQIETVTPDSSATNENEATSEMPLLTLHIKTNDGKSRAVEYRGEDNGAKESSFSFFGNRKMRRLFPKNYLPANASEKLRNKQIRVINYQYQNGGGFNVLWLPDNE